MFLMSTVVVSQFFAIAITLSCMCAKIDLPITSIFGPLTLSEHG